MLPEDGTNPPLGPSIGREHAITHAVAATNRNDVLRDPDELTDAEAVPDPSGGSCVGAC
jgi:hypothetical protein